MKDLPPIKANIKTGEEVFVGSKQLSGVTLKDFWKWSTSDLVSNATRGILAEYLVASALGLNQGIRNEWDAFDLKSEKGIKIEVKSAAYVQSRYQRKLSTISFDVRPTLAWEYETNLQAKEKKRQADIYVFCLLHHKDNDTINPMDLTQWIFHVVSKKRLEQEYPQGKSIGLSRLKKLDPKICNFDGLRQAVEDISKSVPPAAGQ